MKPISRHSLVIVGLVVAATARGFEGDPALLDAGGRVIKSLAPLPAGSEVVSYFELRMSPTQTIGYSIVTLKASVERGKPVYLYTSNTAIRSPNNAQILAFVETKLRPDFEPIQMEMRRATVDPSANRKSVVERAVFGSDKVTLSADDGTEKVSRDVPLPQRPFISGIEMLVQQIDLDAFKSFILHEFSLHGGGAEPLIFEIQTATDGTRSIVTGYSDGETSYQFWFDRNDKLERWGERSMPFLFVRSSKEKVDRLRPSIDSNGTP